MNDKALEAAARAALGEEVWDAPETTDNLKQYWRDTMCEGIEAYLAALPDDGLVGEARTAAARIEEHRRQAMTNEMIEAVARAIAVALKRNHIFDTESHWYASRGYEVQREDFSKAANLAIAAHKSALAKAGLGIRPREATEEMVMAGQHAYDKTDCGLTDAPSPIEAAWQAMWDAHPDKPDG